MPYPTTKTLRAIFLGFGLGLSALPVFADSPVATAVREGNIALLKELIQAGANVNEDKNTFEYAIKKGDLEIVKVLNEGKVAFTYDGLVKAIRMDRLEIMTYLLTNSTRKLNPVQTGSRIQAGYDDTFPAVAVKNRNAKMLQLLLENGASPFIPYKDHKYTPIYSMRIFFTASDNNDADCLRALFDAYRKQGPAPYTQQEFFTLMYYMLFEKAIRNGNASSLEVYFSNGGKVNQVFTTNSDVLNWSGFNSGLLEQTPLHLMAELAAKSKKNFGKAFDYLMTMKPDTAAKNKSNLTPYLATMSLSKKDYPFAAEVAEAIKNNGETKLGKIVLPAAPTGKMGKKRIIRFDGANHVMKVREREGYESMSTDMYVRLSQQGKNIKEMMASDKDFSVLEETVILHEGKPGTMADLQAGKVVDIEYFDLAGENCAMKIRIGKAPEPTVTVGPGLKAAGSPKAAPKKKK